MVNTTQMKAHIKLLYLLLLFQFLFRTFLFLVSTHSYGGFGIAIVEYLLFIAFSVSDHLLDAMATLSIIVVLVYSMWKILLDLSYQKNTTSGGAALLLIFIFIYEFLCLAGASFIRYCNAHPGKFLS